MNARAQGPAWNELAAAAAFLFAVGIAAYGWYVLNGGFYGDDWGNAGAYSFSRTPRYLTAVGDQFRNLGGRPVLAALLPLPHAVFGVHPSLHLALGVALAATTSLCCYVVLRLLRLERVDAAAISGLALLFPWADAIELWPTASINTIAVIFFFLGVALALLGLRRGGRSGAAMHGGAALLYLLSVLTYEVAGAAAALAGLLYLGRAPLARALRRWCFDVVVVTSGLVYSLERTIPVRHVGTLHERLSDLPGMTRQARVLFELAVVPVGRQGGAIHHATTIAAAALVVVLVVRLIRGSGDHTRVWLYLALGCGVAIAAAYFMLLGSGLRPLDPATGTRDNVFARFAYAGLVYAVIAALTGLLVRTHASRRAITLTLVGLIAAGYAVRLAKDESAWARAARLQRDVMRAIDDRLPQLSSGTTVATFDFPAEVRPGAPIFVATWDLTGALDIARRDPTLHAYPIYESVTVSCRAEALVIHLPGSRGTAAARYGKLFFLDVKTGRTARISNSRSCSRRITRFPAGRYFAP